MEPRIEEIRRKRGITQKFIADQLEVSQQLVSRWGKGTSYPNVIQAYQLAKLLFVDVNELYKEE